jgi:hypothetical protein
MLYCLLKSSIGVLLFKLLFAMKKLFLLLWLGICSTPFVLSAATMLEDTSLVRISTADARADFLSRMMKDRLDLDDEEFIEIQAINVKYETLLQELTLANPASSFSYGAKKKVGNSPFDKLSEARDKEVKKVLPSKVYREYDKQRWGMRNALKKQMIADKQERDRAENERQAALEKARIEKEAAAAAAAMESKKSASKNSKKKPAKKSAPKKKK